MAFGAPIFLFALLGMVIPLVIHLWSKSTRNKVAFGSLKFLKESETRTTRHLYPGELLLLLVRMLLFASLAVLFALPFMPADDKPRIAHLVDPVIDRETRENILLTIPDQAEVFWLNHSRKKIADSLSGLNHETWSAIEEFSDFDSLVIYSPEFLTSFQADRAKTSAKINWIDVPIQEWNAELLSIQKGNRSVALHVSSSGEQTTFHFSDAENGTPKTVRVFLHGSEHYEKLARLVRAALTSISNQSLVTLSILDFKTDQGLTGKDWLIWLSDEKPPRRKKMVYLSDQYALLDEVSHEIYAMATDATADKMIMENFPLLLEAVLLRELNDSLGYQDRRQMPTPQLQTVNADVSPEKKTETRKSITGWAWGIFLVLLLVERIMSGSVLQVNKKT